jgi:hypothetical protein
MIVKATVRSLSALANATRHMIRRFLYFEFSSSFRLVAANERGEEVVVTPGDWAAATPWRAL